MLGSIPEPVRWSHLQLYAVKLLAVVIRLLDLCPAGRCYGDVTPINGARTQGKALLRKALYSAGKSGAVRGLDEVLHHVLADGMGHPAGD